MNAFSREDAYERRLTLFPKPSSHATTLTLERKKGIANMLAEELGYEDQEEFEDALKSSFAEFIGALPHIETRNMESELQPGLFRDVFRVIPDPPPSSARRSVWC